ncbi:AEC family transporter [Siculibacillus lacustris]|uniref:AEC family transporter n=1 Tax=Siculibacillus lacustris TaxID=1549641 RepID=A0A4Q9VQ77_9HYPH|nr:AEC family transporter [Siculibacillus lacustris]TBW37967.1 AEC family transporter [Siculibacillus lacustris]
MQQVLALALPFFGLIFIGWACGKWRRLPAEGLAWLNFFVVWVSLPALFFQLLSRTPIEQLANWSFVATTTFSTAVVFALALGVGLALNRGNLREAAITAVAGAYSNIGYMGPGLTAAALGPEATVPTALVFCFDNALLFTLVPLLMALADRNRRGFLPTARDIVGRILLHPFILATIAGVGAAALQIHPPVVIDRMLTSLMQAAAPCALFAMGVTVGLRPVERITAEIPLVLTIKLIVHPLLVFALLVTIGGFPPIWVETALLMACLPPALNVYVLAQQYHAHLSEASAIVLIGTVVSVATVTAFLYLVTQGLLPTAF